MIQIGFSMHPNWAQGDALRAFLDPLRAAGLTALEFELDSNDPKWPEFGPLMAACRDLGYNLCFHAPYRGSSRPTDSGTEHSWTLAGFADEQGEEMARSLAPLFDIAAQYGPTTVVVHGAKAPAGQRTRRLLHADTLIFFEWAMDQYPTLTLALENGNPVADVTKIGDNRAELLHIVREVDYPALGICWDIGHDVNAGRLEVPGPLWLRQVQHVHIHDLDDAGQDHLPLIYGRVLPQRWLPPLVRTGFDGIVTLELNGRRCAFLWPDRIMPALVDSVRAIAAAIAEAQQDSPACRLNSGPAGAGTGSGGSKDREGTV
jgi:sugar phosphate isomerase/epimerase